MKNYLLTVGALALAVLGASTAQAAPGTSFVRYSSDGGATWTTVQDNGAGDTQGAVDGVISFGFSSGAYSISVVGTLTKPFGGVTPGQPFMDLIVGGVVSGSGGLIVEFSDTGWTPVPTGAFSSRLAVNETGSHTVTLNTRAGANVAFAGPPFALSSVGPLSGLTTDSATAPVPGLAAPYSITLSTVFANTSGFGNISTDASIQAVPEGGSTLLLLGGALSALALLARCRKTNA